tara:strand:- start:120 stop:557 length:438 start_codon:yes stop_codon:yes gene_type:complete
MKIYLQDVILNDISKLLQSNLHITKLHKNYIYSYEGIYTIIRNNIYKLDIINNNSLSINNYINNITAFIDTSSITPQKDVSYQIPIPNTSHQLLEYNIKINKDSIISLIIETNNNIISDWFFITDESYDNPFIKEDINKFISQFM